MKRRELDRLLGRGRFARPEKEALLAGALADAAPRPARARWRWLLPLGVTALVLLVAAPLLRPRPDGVRPKGAATALVLEAGCDGVCRPGATLLFRVGHLAEPGRLAVFAEAAGQERVWYFPSADGELPALSPREAPALVPRGVKLGAEHAAGRWRLTALVVRRPLEREALLSLAGGTEHPDLVGVARASIEVAP